MNSVKTQKLLILGRPGPLRNGPNEPKIMLGHDLIHMYQHTDFGVCKSHSFYIILYTNLKVLCNISL